jgi:hypothetical protein
MADHTDHTNNTYRETRIEERRSGGGAPMAFIVGGLVVAVAIIAWLFTGGDFGTATTTGGAGDVNVSVETPADGGEATLADEAVAPAGDAEVAAPAD